MGSYSIKNVGIVNQLDRMEKDMQFMKNRQYIGRRTLITKITEYSDFLYSHDAWFFDPGGPPQLQAQQHLIYFTADNQLNPFGRLIVEFYDMAGNKIDYASSSYSNGPVIDELYTHVTYVDDKTLKFELWTAGPPDMPYKVKPIVAATDSGAITNTVDVYNY